MEKQIIHVSDCDPEVCAHHGGVTVMESYLVEYHHAHNIVWA